MEEFGEIYRAYFGRLYAFLLRLCRNADLAEELTQESFYQALRSFHRYDGSCELFTWLAAIGKNVWLKQLRRSSRSPEDLAPFEELLRAGDDSQPEEILSRRETAKAVRAAVKALPKKSRDVVILRIYGDLPFREIASSLKISESSAKVIFFRAKNSLREALADGNQ